MKRILTPSIQSRQGASLVELVVTMGFASIVLGTGIGTLLLLLRTDKTLTDSLWRSQTVANLSETFRSDVHAARSIKAEQPANDPAPPVFVLELAEGHSVRYWNDKHTLFRKETQADKILQEERFRFSPGTVISFKIDGQKSAALIIQSQNPSTKERLQTPTNVPLRELKIEAVAGRDHRWSGEAQQTAEESR